MAGEGPLRRRVRHTADHGFSSDAVHPSCGHGGLHGVLEPRSCRPSHAHCMYWCSPVLCQLQHGLPGCHGRRVTRRAHCSKSVVRGRSAGPCLGHILALLRGVLREQRNHTLSSWVSELVCIRNGDLDRSDPACHHELARRSPQGNAHHQTELLREDLSRRLAGPHLGPCQGTSGEAGHTFERSLPWSGRRRHADGERMRHRWGRGTCHCGHLRPHLLA
mmetsp:Transcript_18399/g.61580  ORF Transcript_18399/g.61580 Transcript_18399/m.61580 type:complete len:219 (+) Transcript_18399:326-982(+)